MVDAFRGSIRPARVRPLILSGIVAVLLVGRLLVSAVAEVVAGALGWASADLAMIEPVQEAIDTFATVVTQVSAASVTAVMDVLQDADPKTRALLGLSLLAAVYLVCRPLFPGLRLKRVLWNLADEPADALRTTVPSWHVSRATGLYVRERRVLSGEGCSSISGNCLSTSC